MMVLSNKLDAENLISKTTFEKFLLILAPFAPHITQELWKEIGNKKFILAELWPTYILSTENNSPRVIMIQVNGKIRGQFKAAGDLDEKEAIDMARKEPSVESWIEGKEIKKTIYVKNKLVSFVV